MLPNDAKTRREEAREKSMEQTQVSDHFNVVKLEDKPEPYSDEVFKEAALRWLIETDQVSALSIIIPFSIYCLCSRLLHLSIQLSNV